MMKTQKDARNAAILFGLMLKAQAMTPLCLVLGTKTYAEDVSALLTSLALAFVLSAVEHATTTWKIVLWSAFLTSAACCAELLWLAHIGKLGAPISHYGVFPTVLFIGALYLIMGGFLVLARRNRGGVKTGAARGVAAS